MNRQLVTLKQAVEMRPWLTMRYARRLIGERRLGHYKAGARVLIDLHELDAWVNRGRVEAIRND
jgi:excisionase family DNA binding protein